MSARERSELLSLFRIRESDADEVMRRDYNVAPSKKAPVVVDAAADGEGLVRQLRMLRWGLVPGWAKDAKRAMNNARAETVHEKPTFRKAFAHKRCLIPVDGFYEWFPLPAESGKPAKQPYYLTPKDGGVLTLAGIYEWWRNPELDDDHPDAWAARFAVLTTTAHDSLGQLHERMPMMITPGDWQAWLDPGLSEVEQVRTLMTPAQDLLVYPVSTAVNSVRNNGPELIQPLAG